MDGEKNVVKTSKIFMENPLDVMTLYSYLRKNHTKHAAWRGVWLHIILQEKLGGEHGKCIKIEQRTAEVTRIGCWERDASRSDEYRYGYNYHQTFDEEDDALTRPRSPKGGYEYGRIETPAPYKYIGCIITEGFCEEFSAAELHQPCNHCSPKEYTPFSYACEGCVP